MSSESMTLPFERNNAPGSRSALGQTDFRLAAQVNGHINEVRLFRFTGQLQRQLAVIHLNFPGPKFNTALPLPACPWVAHSVAR